MFPRNALFIGTTAAICFQIAEDGLGQRAVGILGRFILFPRFCRLHRRAITGGRGVIYGDRVLGFLYCPIFYAATVQCVSEMRD